MKKNEDLKVGRNLKKFVYLTSLVGIGLFFNGCMGGYVMTEPTYSESVRPAQPGSAYIWINGDWNWNRQSGVYVQRTGYWQQPAQGRVYVTGHWQKSPKGNYWVSGRWEKQNNRQNGRRNR
jgi:hypothetical protein